VICLLPLLILAAQPPDPTAVSWLAARANLSQTEAAAILADPNPNPLAVLRNRPPAKLCYNAMWFSEPGQTVDQWRKKVNKQYGLTDCSWIFHAQLFPGSSPNYDDTGWIDEAKVTQWLSGVPASAAVFINLEPSEAAWPYWHVLNSQGTAVNPTGLANRVQLLEWFRSRRPDCRYGYFAQVPWPWTEPGDAANLESWRKVVKDSSVLTRSVDFLVPQIYVRPNWSLEFAALCVDRMVLACRDYAPGKPVYPILSPYYRAVEAEEFMPPLWWRALLEHAFLLSEGPVIWGGYLAEWNEDAPWWRETTDFLSKVGVMPQ